MDAVIWNWNWIEVGNWIVELVQNPTVLSRRNIADIEVWVDHGYQLHQKNIEIGHFVLRGFETLIQYGFCLTEENSHSFFYSPTAISFLFASLLLFIKRFKHEIMLVFLFLICIEIKVMAGDIRQLAYDMIEKFVNNENNLPLTKLTISSSVTSLYPLFLITNAIGKSPSVSCGLPITQALCTAGCSRIISSSSLGETCKL